MSEALRLIVRTPYGVVWEGSVTSLRVPTETGLVGLRPRGEQLVLAVESGLVVGHTNAATQFVATAGGLLETDGQQCTVFTPFAVTGSSEEEMLDALAQMRETPSEELAARQKLEELERRVANELQRPSAVPPRRPRNG